MLQQVVCIRFRRLIKLASVRFDDPRAVTMMITFFWNVTPYSLADHYYQIREINPKD
jgi:hypothetical protein